MQDSKGYLWFGTDAGVSRFDGRRFENFTIDDGLPDNQIIQIKEDHKGRIWFIAFNGELSYFLDGLIYNSKNDKSLRLLKFNAVIISMFQDSKNRLWFGTNKNMLYMFDGKSLTKFSGLNPSYQFIFTYVNEDAKGRIWAYSSQCVRIFENGKFRFSGQAPVHPQSYKTIMNLRDNSLLYINKSGLNFRKGETNKVLRKLDDTLLEANLGFFYANADGLWLSHNKGIYHVDNQEKKTTYLQGISAVQVIKDSKNNMWFTTTEGIYMLPRKANRLFIINKSHGLSSNEVKSITKDKNNNLWLGMDAGFLNKINVKALRVDQIEIPVKNTYSSGLEKVVIDESSESLYFASDYGLGVLHQIYKNPKKFSFLKETNHSFFAIKDFSINKDSSLALALSSGVALLKDIRDKLELNVYELKDGIDFFKYRSYTVYYDPAGTLWFANIKGLNKFDEKITAYHKNPLLTKRINDIERLPDGTLVLATDGYGLVFMKGNKIVHHFTQLDGLASNICKKIYISKDHVWVVTNMGINRVCINEGSPTVKAFEYTNALLKSAVNDIFIDRDTAYFATDMGLVYFNHIPHQSILETPKALISSIIVNDKKRSLKDPAILLHPSSNKITFYLGAIDFQEQDIIFRYRLKPEDEWTETRNRRIEAVSLKPGQYTFEVCARTNSSDWGPSVKTNFELKARFWQTTLFLLLLFSIAGITFYGIAVVVTKKQKNKEQQRLLLKNKVLMLEQKALQAMMNPHFVFNVMNSIQHYINTKDTGSANKVLTGFARLIRKNMEICTKSYISLQEELEYLQLYLSLEQKRFGDKLGYEIKIDPQIDKEETFIPSMLLQPYIENAIWHGIMPIETGGELKITLHLKEQHTLEIEIRDNGIGIENSLKHKKNSHNSKGMSLTQERINLLNQIEANPIQIRVQQNGASGTSVLISIILP